MKKSATYFTNSSFDTYEILISELGELRFWLELKLRVRASKMYELKFPCINLDISGCLIFLRLSVNNKPIGIVRGPVLLLGVNYLKCIKFGMYLIWRMVRIRFLAEI